MTTICVLGMWHLGLVTAACFSELGYTVIGFDFDQKVINDLNQNILPIHEPGLTDLVVKNQKKHRLSFTSNLIPYISDSDYVYIAFDTPIDSKDKIDLSVIHKAIDSFIPLLNDKSVILVSSQIPVGTSNLILKKLREKGKINEISYIPENLRLGTAISSFMNPDRIVIGLSSEKIKVGVLNLFFKIKAKKLVMDLTSAEMVKHVLNSYLATMISFSGEISDLCEKTGANAIKVMEALKAEKRVSEFAPIMPGLGFGGGTLARDVNILRNIATKNKIKARLLDSVMDINKDRMHYVHHKLNSLFSSLNYKKITFLGLTYKANTNTLRRSLALDVIKELDGKNLVINAYDPMIKNKIKDHDYINVFTNVKDALKGADALVITTDWDEFKQLNYPELSKLMKNPIIVDAKNMLNFDNFRNTNIRYYGIGISSLP